MTVVDLGASIGYYTLLASRLVGPSGHVYSFEPDPEANHYLRRNIKENRCENIVVVDKAAAELTQTVSFVRPELERGFVSAGQKGSMTIEATTMDAFFGGLGWPDVHIVKMDIEGSEESALLGMGDLVRRNPTIQIIMELNQQAMRRAGRTWNQLMATLKDLGFSSGYVIELDRTMELEAFSGSRAIHNLLLSRSRPSAPIG
jgi:FkbM family methyltransferase